MMSKIADTTESDVSTEIEELLAELEEHSISEPFTPDSDSSYNKPAAAAAAALALHSSNDAHARSQSDINILPTEEEESTGSPSLHASAQEASHADVAHAGAVFCNDDAFLSKLSHTHQCKARRLAVDKPPSPPPSPPPHFGCSCFSFPSHKRVQEQKKFSTEEFASSKAKEKAKIHQANADHDDNDDDWRFVLNEIRPGQVDTGGLFDVKKAEKEFKRVSLKERQLTKEAQKVLDTISSS